VQNSMPFCLTICSVVVLHIVHFFLKTRCCEINVIARQKCVFYQEKT
jgi:hypothetical protein